MQRCNCSVRLAGDQLNTVFKTNVTPAEIVILRHIHGGADSVVDIQPTRMDATPHAQERQRLAYLYKQEVVDHLFPGAFSKLPVTLKDISIEQDDVTDLDESGEPATQDAPEGSFTSAVEVLEKDDLELIETVMTAKTRAELQDLAQTNEVDLSGVPERMDDMKRAIITGLFPTYKM